MKDLDKFRRRPKYIRYLAGYFTLFVGSLAARIKISGRNFIPDDGPYIIAANHFSVLDPFFVLYAVQRPVNFLMASDQVVGMDMSWAPWLYGYIPTNRSRLAPSTIKRSLAVLKRREILGIFPEGTSLSTRLRPAKDGAAYLSLATSAPILPVSIYGTVDLWTNLLRGVRQTVHVNIGRPFGPFNKQEWGSSRQEQLTKVGEEIMCRIGSLLPDEQRGFLLGEERLSRYQAANVALSGSGRLAVGGPGSQNYQQQSAQRDQPTDNGGR